MCQKGLSMAAPSGGSLPVHVDEYGVERMGPAPKETLNDKLRRKSRVYDRLFEMQFRYSQQGGSQFAAGITYFSVLAVVPLLMVVFAVTGHVIGGSPDLYNRLEGVIRDNFSGQLGDMIVDVIQTAINQTGSVAVTAFLVGMWTGLYWMTTLRRGMTSIWKRDIVPTHWFLGKAHDLLVLIGMSLMLILTFAVTAVGSSSVLHTILGFIGRGDNDVDRVLIRIATLVIGMLANWILFFWLLKTLPFGYVPSRPAFRYAFLGAIALELLKSFGSLFFASAVRNPAGAMFGPVIGLMVILYLLWRITLYLAALTATSKEGLETLQMDTPAPAVVLVRKEAAVQAGFAGTPLDDLPVEKPGSDNGKTGVAAVFSAALARAKGESGSRDKDDSRE